jgi:hypothetical protein
MRAFAHRLFAANRGLRSTWVYVPIGSARDRYLPTNVRGSPTGRHVRGIAMRNYAALPTSTALPMGYRPTPGQHQLISDNNFDLAAIVHFNDVLHSIHPDAPHVDADRFANLANWIMDLPPQQSRKELRQRLARIADLKKMAADRDWDTDESQRSRVNRLLDYLTDPDDVISNSTPRLGRLDDALLVELAWPAFADEVEDYLDFCRFRHEQHPRGSPPLKRSAWIRMRMAEGALWQQLQRVHHTRYAEYGPISEGLRVI